MDSYSAGYAVGQLVVGLLFIWLGVKGFSENGLAITKSFAIRGWAGKIVGGLLLIWGLFSCLSALSIVIS